DDGLVVLVQRNAAEIEGARTAEVAGLDFEHIELAVTILVDPFADGVAVEAGLDLLWPGAAIGEDASSGLADIVDADIRDARQHDDFHRLVGRHGRRHAGRQTGSSPPGGGAAPRALAQIRFADRLAFGRPGRPLS